MRIFIVSIFLFFSCFLHAQIEVRNIEVGSLIKIVVCKKGQKNFESMDVYARESLMDKSHVDSLSGEGIFEAFFKGSGIDAKRLPCIMGGRKYKIAALKEFEVDKKIKRVILCYTASPLTLIWIDLDRAIETKEIDFN